MRRLWGTFSYTRRAPSMKRMSSPTVNHAWALFNLIVGYLLFRLGNVRSGDDSALLIFFADIATISIMMSEEFAKKHRK